MLALRTARLLERRYRASSPKKENIAGPKKGKIAVPSQVDQDLGVPQEELSFGNQELLCVEREASLAYTRHAGP